MKKFVCVFSLLIYSSIWANDLFIAEYHTTSNNGWRDFRIGTWIRPFEKVKELSFYFRKGIGGPDPTLVMGYDVKINKIILTPWMGISLDDKLEPVSFRPGFSIFGSWKKFKGVSIFDLTLPISEKKSGVYTTKQFYGFREKTIKLEYIQICYLT